MNNKNKQEIEKIINFFKLKNFKKVIELSQIFLKKNAESDFILNILGLSFQKMRKLDDAETSLIIANQINPENISVLNNLGNNFKYKLNFSEAKKYFTKALKINPKYTEALLNLGIVEFTTNNNEEALGLFQKALETNSKAIPIHLNLAITYQSLGYFEKAIIHLKEINTIDEKFTRSDKMLSTLYNYENNPEHLKIMLNKLEKLQLTNEQKIYLSFGIGKAFEDQKKFKDAFYYFKLGNKLKNNNSFYKIDNDEILAKEIKSLFKNYKFQLKTTNEANKKPIFILGMPRSGTTLIEQIISSHSQVQGFGEINFFNLIAEQEFKKEINLNQLDVNKILDRYERLINSFNLSKSHFTDKTLLNFWWVGFIKICYPNAKIINCTRNKKDNCLSIYKNLFDYEGGWCYEENNLIKYYKIYLELIDFWKKIMPSSIYEIHYEKIIDNPNEEIKRLIKHCDLEWDEKCINFFKNKTAIKTLSVNQARKKIYSTSINSYDNYKEISGDFLKNID